MTIPARVYEELDRLRKTHCLLEESITVHEKVIFGLEAENRGLRFQIALMEIDRDTGAGDADDEPPGNR